MTLKFPPNATPSVKTIIECVDAWYDITFQYETRTYTVLGALVVLDKSKRLCLWGDVLAIDKEPQKLVMSKCFYIEGFQGPVDKGKPHGRCSNDYWSIELDALDTYTRGPRWERAPSRSKSNGRLTKPEVHAGSQKRSQTSRAKLDALFKP